MRRALSAAAIAAFVMTGLTGGAASADGPLECTNPKYQKACELVNAVVDLSGTGVPSTGVECNHPWYSGLCKTINDLVHS